MDNRNKALGVILIFLGGFFLLENLNIIEFNFLQIWPAIVILGGIGFWLGYLANRKQTALIMPGTILILYGALFMYCNIFGWIFMERLWPVFLLGPGIGFFILYFLGKRERSLILPGTLLTVLGLLFIFRYLPYLKYWPTLLIIGGVIIIFLPGRKSANTVPEPNQQQSKQTVTEKPKG
jgi:hypothetical protein